MQRFLLALALLTCSTAVLAGAPKSGAEPEPQTCVPVADNDCDLQPNGISNSGSPRQSGTPANDTSRRSQRKPARQESSRSTLRFQSFLPGMIR